MTTLSLLDWIICIGYLAIVLGLGLWFARAQHSNEDYFVGGRRMHWLPIGLSLFAGTFSSLSFVGLPRAAAYEDYHLLLGILFIPFVVSPIVGWIFIPLFHRMRVTSANEYLERRFSRNVRLIASVLVMFYTVGWMGSMLVAVGKILQVVLALSSGQLVWVLIAVGVIATLYTTLGGVQAVVWTDALQAVALGGGMIIVLLLAVAKIDGGFATVWEVGTANDKFDMFHMKMDFKSGNLYSACAFGFFVYLAGHAVNFTTVQRYVSMPSVAAARRSLIVNGLMVGGVCAVFFLVGTVLFVYYQQNDPATFQALKEAKRGDQLLPTFVIRVLPPVGLTGLLLAGLFAAAMSSMDSGINSMTASVVCDWMSDRDLPLMGSRIVSIIFGAAAVSAAILINAIGGAVFPIIMTIAGTFLGLLFGVFLLGMLSPRANTQGAIIGLLFAGGVFLLAKMGGMSHWWDGMCTSMTTLVAGLFASLAFPPPKQSQLAGIEVGRQD